MKNLILVHGFWADSSCYSAIIPVLQRAGYNVLAPQMPLSSLADDVAAVNRALDTIEGDCLLIGHSYGGVVITQAGVRPNVKGLLYIAAFAPDKGETMNDLLRKNPPTAAAPFFEIKDGYVWLRHEGFRTAFAQDLPIEQADVLHAVQKVPNAAIFETPAEEVAWKDKKSWFIISKADRTIDPHLQHFEAQRMHATINEVAASHLSMISQPAAVVRFIEAAAQELLEHRFAHV
jgi:pimeloyl-ACP methyl ester carboxylesterase